VGCMELLPAVLPELSPARLAGSGAWHGCTTSVRAPAQGPASMRWVCAPGTGRPPLAAVLMRRPAAAACDPRRSCSKLRACQHCRCSAMTRDPCWLRRRPFTTHSLAAAGQLRQLATLR
jgi:hypothetical protein